MVIRGGQPYIPGMADDVTERLAALERRLDRLEALLSGPVRTPPPPIVVPAVPPPVARPSLEQAIGLRWAGAAGAIAVVIGAGLGIEFAYRQGWFTIVPPGARVAALVAVAAGLIGVGEVVYRRVNVRSAVGPFAAGVAVLFLAAYAGFAFYGLYGRGMAYGLMAAATVVGAAVARRGNLVSIAAVAIVGGGLAPALLHAGEPRPAGFLGYLLTLQIVAVALAFGGGRKWWALRGLSLAVTAVWVAAVLPSPAFGGAVTVAFVLAFAGLFHAERVASASVDADADAAGSVAFGLCVTAALAAAVLFLSRQASDGVRTAEVLAMAVVAAAVAVGCVRVGRGGLRAVGMGFGVQAVGLVALAVPVAVSGGSVVVGWGLLAVALAVGGRWSAAAAYAGPPVWTLAAFDLLLWADRWVGDGHAGDAVATVAGHAVPAYVATAWGLAVGGHLVAGLTRRRAAVDGRAEMAGVVDGLSAVTWVAASLVGLPGLGATAAVVAYAAGLVAAAAVVSAAVPAAVAVFVAVKWMAFDAVLNRAAGGTTAAAAALGGALVAVLVGVGWAIRRRPVGRRAVRAFTVLAGVWAASVAVDAAFAAADGRRFAEPDRAEQVALSVLWAATAAAVVAAGFGRRLADLRYVGLALFAVTGVKVVAVDLSGVGTGYRVLSFLGLGGLLLATSVLYGRAAAGNADRPAAAG